MRGYSLLAGVAVALAPAFAWAQRAVVVHVTGERGAVIQQADGSGPELEWTKVCTSPCTARVPANTYYRAWQSLETPSKPIWLSDDNKEVSFTVTSAPDTTTVGSVLTVVGATALIGGGVVALVGAAMRFQLASFSFCFSTTPCPAPPPPDHTAADITAGVGVAMLVTGLVLLTVGVALRNPSRSTDVTRIAPWTRVAPERAVALAPPVIGLTVVRLAF